MLGLPTVDQVVKHFEDNNITPSVGGSTYTCYKNKECCALPVISALLCKKFDYGSFVNNIISRATKISEYRVIYIGLGFDRAKYYEQPPELKLINPDTDEDKEQANQLYYYGFEIGKRVWKC